MPLGVTVVLERRRPVADEALLVLVGAPGANVRRAVVAKRGAHARCASYVENSARSSSQISPTVQRTRRASRMA